MRIAQGSVASAEALASVLASCRAALGVSG
jgi:hypothetical protein